MPKRYLQVIFVLPLAYSGTQKHVGFTPTLKPTPEIQKNFYTQPKPTPKTQQIFTPKPKTLPKTLKFFFFLEYFLLI